MIIIAINGWLAIIMVKESMTLIINVLSMKGLNKKLYWNDTK